MDHQEILEHCLAKPGAWPDNPFHEHHPVVKVGAPERAKIFAFVGSSAVGVKAGRSRDEADQWLQRYPDDARAMSYIGRHGWNDLGLGGAIPDDELIEAVETSYRLVVLGLPMRYRPPGWEG